MPLDYDKYAKQSDYAKFDEVGTTYIGVIKEAREGRDYNQNPCPEYVIEQEDGTEITITAGQVLLKKAFTEKRPQEGDKIRVSYTGLSDDAKPGKAPAKLFTVDVKPGPHEMQNPVAANSEAPF